MSVLDRILIVPIWFFVISLYVRGSQCGAAELSLDVLMGSHHFQHSPKYNERNPGLGLNYMTEDIGFHVGRYYNSHRRTSRYRFLSIPLVRRGRHNLYLMGGSITGYEYTKAGGFLVYRYSVLPNVRLMFFIVPVNSGVVGYGLNIPITSIQKEED